MVFHRFEKIQEIEELNDLKLNGGCSDDVTYLQRKWRHHLLYFLITKLVLAFNVSYDSLTSPGPSLSTSSAMKANLLES